MSGMMPGQAMTPPRLPSEDEADGPDGTSGGGGSTRGAGQGPAGAKEGGRQAPAKSMSALISVSDLTKRYGRTLAVAGVSFDVGAREVVGFLGPNGAGKSTTLRMLAGFLGRSGGSIRIAGFDLDQAPLEAKQRVGYMPETVPLYPEMRVREYLRFRAELKGVARADRSQHVASAMQKANVADVADVLIERLSKGYRQRVGLADALVAKPPILILDEPTAGLDPNQIREVRDVIRELGREHAVLLSTHILSEVEATCDRVLVIGKGKLLAQGATRDIRSLAKPRALEITVRGDATAALAATRAIAAFSKVEPSRGGDDKDQSVFEASFASDADPDAAAEALFDALAAAGIKVREMRRLGGGLEEVFADLTRDERAGAAA
jgi:ABC-2 type transport system ATP-binding protein